MSETEPTWQPLSAVGAMTGIVADQLDHTRHQLQLLEQAQPGMLDDATVTRTIEVYGVMAGDYRDLFAQQALRWTEAAAGEPAATQTAVTVYADLVTQHLKTLAAILTLADHLKASTIEAIMATPDDELALQHLSGTGVYAPRPARR